MADSSILAVNASVPTWFVYEDLLRHVQTLQLKIIEISKCLTEQQKTEPAANNKLKARSLTLVDPFGNPVSNTYMDHELMSAVFQKYKKEYIPRYLQAWIKLGRLYGDVILPLSDYEMKSTVSQFPESVQFITYGEVTVWTVEDERFLARSSTFSVRLTDNIEKIKAEVTKRPRIRDVELKSISINGSESPNEEQWKEGKAITVADTISSAQLYQPSSAVMAKLIKETVLCTVSFSAPLHWILFSCLGGHLDLCPYVSNIC